MKWMELRKALVAALASCLFAAAASAGTVEGLLLAKVSATRTLKMEDGITVQVQDDTEIRDRDGKRLSLDDIPDPVEVAGSVMLTVEGPSSNGTVQATRITLWDLLLR